MKTQVRSHLETLYRHHIDAGHYPDSALFSISWKDGNRFPSARYPLSNLDAIEKKLFSLTEEGKDAYYRVSPLESKEYASGSRGAAADGLGLPALFLDIDTQDGVHKPFVGSQEGMPHPTTAQALELAHKLGTPGLIVQSGGGIHVYYLLAEVLQPGFIDRAGRLSLDQESFGQKLLRRFDAHATSTAHAMGFGIDRGIAADSARILRPSGTVNFKDPTALKPVTLRHASTAKRYTLEELDATLPQLPDRKAKERARITNPKTALATLRQAQTRSRIARRFEEKVPVSYLMEEVWHMEEVGSGWCLPQDDGWVTSETQHCKTTWSENGKVESVAVYGARLQEAWGIADEGFHRPNLTSWDLLLLAVNDDLEAAEMIAEAFPEPDDDLLTAIEQLANSAPIES